jgi:2-hydroxychromene-2-carboxylate isomerase
MGTTLDFFFEFASTYSYPAAMRIGALAREAIADADGQEARSRATSTREGRRTPVTGRAGRRQHAPARAAADRFADACPAAFAETVPKDRCSRRPEWIAAPPFPALYKAF